MGSVYIAWQENNPDIVRLSDGLDSADAFDECLCLFVETIALDALDCFKH